MIFHLWCLLSLDETKHARDSEALPCQAEFWSRFVFTPPEASLETNASQISLLFFFVSFLHRYSFFRCQWIRAMGEYLHIVKAGFQSTTALWRLWFVRQICGTVHLQPIQNDNVGDCRLLYNNCSRREGRNERQVAKKDIAILPVAKSRPSKGLAGWCGIEKRPLATGSEKLYYFCQESAIPALKLRCFGTISLESLSGLILDLFDGLLQLKYPINPRPNIPWHHCCLTAEDPLENNQAT